MIVCLFIKVQSNLKQMLNMPKHQTLDTNTQSAALHHLRAQVTQSYHSCTIDKNIISAPLNCEIIKLLSKYSHFIGTIREKSSIAIQILKKFIKIASVPKIILQFWDTNNIFVSSIDCTFCQFKILI